MVSQNSLGVVDGFVVARVCVIEHSRRSCVKWGGDNLLHIEFGLRLVHSACLVCSTQQLAAEFENLARNWC